MNDVVSQDVSPSTKRFRISLQEAKEPVDKLVAFQTYSTDRRSEQGEPCSTTDADAVSTERVRMLGTASLKRVKARRASSH
jgi:hypothetical protein